MKFDITDLNVILEDKKYITDIKTLITPRDVQQINKHLFPNELKAFQMNPNDPMYDTDYYYFNKNGFRCDEFKKDHDGKHIVFLGCSETQGQGGPLDEAWAYILYKKIGEVEKTSGYYNLAVAGSFIEHQFIYLMDYIKEFGKPDYIFALWPNIERVFIRDKGHIGPFNYVTGMEDHKLSIEMKAEMTFRNLFYLRILESYCKSAGIKLIWSTWEHEAEVTYTMFNFENIIDLSIHDMTEPNNMHDENLLDRVRMTKGMSLRECLDRDSLKVDGHKGFIWHDYFADKYFKKYKEIYDKPV